MSAWLAEWGEPLKAEASGDTAMSSMDEMMSDEEMVALDDARGEEFDRSWMEAMIAHHEGAIAMSETEQSEGRNADAIALAGEIIAAQRGEIDEMTQLLAG